MLSTDVRRKTLRRLGPKGMRLALATNPGSPEDRLQPILSSYILGTPEPIAEGDVERLRHTLQVTEWLAGTVEGLPDPAELRRRIKIESLLRVFRDLAGSNFRGRRAELAQLARYVSAGDRAAPDNRAPLLITARGGMGKSALMGRFILDHIAGSSALPFAYLDFDRSDLAAEEPTTLLIEAVSQLSAQYPEPEAPALVRTWTERLQGRRSTAQSSQIRQFRRSDRSYLLEEGPITEWSESIQEFAVWVETALGAVPGPILVVLDTFEEVQHRSSTFVSVLWQFLDELRQAVDRLRIVVSGRVPVADLPAVRMELQGLEEETALEILDNGVRPIIGTDYEALVSTIADLVLDEDRRASPLSLKLAVELVRRDKQTAQRSIADITERARLGVRLREMLVQGEFYDRILGHIHDEEARKLAHPGLVLRKITPELIKEVLAEPSGLDVPDLMRAEAIFEQFAREVSLVQREGNALRHRGDLRRIMLNTVRQERPSVAREIEERAVAYYARFDDDPTARAEEIYHRLWLGEDPAEVDRRWMSGIEGHLASALEEDLPPSAKAYLANQIGREVDLVVLEEIGQLELERYAQRQAINHLRVGDAKGALEVLHRVSPAERSAGSPLYLLESQALLRLPDPDYSAAEHVALQGIISATAAGDNQELFALHLHAARLQEARGDSDAARQSLLRADAIARRLREVGLQLEVGVQLLRLDRTGKASSASVADSAQIRREVLTLVDRMTDMRLAEQPHVARQAAAEVGAERPDVMARVVSLVGLGEVDGTAAAEAIEILKQWEASSPEAVRRWVRLALTGTPWAEFADRGVEGLTQLMTGEPDGRAAVERVIQQLFTNVPLTSDVTTAWAGWFQRAASR